MTERKVETGLIRTLSPDELAAGSGVWKPSMARTLAGGALTLFVFVIAAYAAASSLRAPTSTRNTVAAVAAAVAVLFSVMEARSALVIDSEKVARKTPIAFLSREVPMCLIDRVELMRGRQRVMRIHTRGGSVARIPIDSELWERLLSQGGSSTNAA